MSADIETFLARVDKLLGPRGLTCDADVMAPWLTDWRGRYTGRALAMASPANASELSDLVKLCAAHGVPIVPQGGNSGMSGGATPDKGGMALLVSLRRMNAIRSIDATSRQAVCEAGVVLQNLHEAAEAQNLRFPLSLGGKGSATIGGLISTNAGGTQVLRHGTMRALVLGLEAVLADGSIWSALSPLKKDNRGFDLKQLFIGSEGTLGIVTAATLKLVPRIGTRAVIWAGLPSLAAARKLLLHCQSAAGDALEGFEALPQSCLDAVLAYLPDARSPLEEPHRWHVLIELVADAQGAESLPGLAEAMLAAAYEKGEIENAAIAINETQAEAFWTLRESISAAERAKGPAMQHDISVAPELMPAVVELAQERVEAAFPGVHAFGYGHLGDGNIHLHVAAPPGSDAASWERDTGKAISRMVHDLVTQHGGSISAEHGIGQLKRDELARLGDPAALWLMRAVKGALDPSGLLNPGKLVPLAPYGTSA